MTAKKAVAIGSCVINLPVLAVIIIGSIASIRLLSDWFVFVGLLLSIATAWFYWSLAVPLWRIWALRSGANAEETQVLAVRAGLVWKRGSVLEKTEIKLPKDHR